jgi:hypothetical protein
MTHLFDPNWNTTLNAQAIFGFVLIPLAITIVLGLLSRLSFSTPSLYNSRRRDIMWLPRFSVGALLGFAICFVALIAIDKLFGLSFGYYFINGLNV